MNEPSNFVDGSVDGCTTGALDNPPFTPRMCFTLFESVIRSQIFISLDVLGGKLISKTLCPSAQQYLSQHYNLHSMFGYFESQASNM
jgi:hypothetical protein